MNARFYDRLAYVLDRLATAVEDVTSAPIRRLERRAYRAWRKRQEVKR
jgi:hypothetical protein